VAVFRWKVTVLGKVFEWDLVFVHEEVVLPFFGHGDFLACLFLVLGLEVLDSLLLLSYFLLKHFAILSST
jgi:hypothetical protein